MSGVIQTPDIDMAAPTKTVTITLRLDPDEHKAWVAAAEADDRSLSSWIRRQCSASAAEASKPKRGKRAT